MADVASPRRRLRKSVFHPAGPNAKQFPSKKPAVSKPSDGKEWVFSSSKHIVPGRSNASTMSSVLHQEEVKEPQPATRLRTAPHADHLKGGSVAVVSPLSQPELYRPTRRPGTAGPRTDIFNTSVGGESVVPTYALLGTSRREVFVTSRPQTAPSCVLRVKAQLRTGFENGRSAHADVLQYRFSGGICPTGYQLNTERNTAPQLASATPTQSRTAFFDSRSSYNANKTRALASNVLAH